MTLNDTELALLPREADIRFYEEHGWFATERILPDELLEDADYGIERYYAGERDFPLLVDDGYLDWRPGHGNILRLNDYVSLQNRELMALARFPLLAAVAACLARTPTVRLFHDQLLYKPPFEQQDDNVVGWHSDRSYWQTCSSDRMLTVWIPLQDCTVQMGTLRMLDGSHRWPESGSMRSFREQGVEGLEAGLAAADRPLHRVDLELKRGQVSFHNALTLHGSGPNLSRQPRIALAVHMQDADNHYRLRHDEQGRPILHINDIACRKNAQGEPDYADPRICPVLWQAA